MGAEGDAAELVDVVRRARAGSVSPHDVFDAFLRARVHWTQTASRHGSVHWSRHGSVHCGGTSTSLGGCGASAPERGPAGPVSP
ncbi:hypothetical protein QF032_004953 [Streptomyces achromogenes]|uniref:hypothetical protein n=1 Tax=Streptomyces achromogenes TaxID=67255 RepID=UPI00278A2965|nr:hypothetical protein [Streptomyces achromogenes]MDQ0833109.1 hypothetical protein [Streptomyces achromogenes]